MPLPRLGGVTAICGGGSSDCLSPYGESRLARRRPATLDSDQGRSRGPQWADLDELRLAAGALRNSVVFPRDT